MRKKLALLLGCIVISMFLFARPVKSYTTVYTHKIVDQDTYIEEYYDRSLPTSSKLQVGCHYISFPDPQWESYFFFNISDKPENITKAEIRISLVRPNALNPYNFSIDVFLIEEPWIQTEIKWTNKPNKSDFIKRFDNEYIADGSNDYLQFDVSEYSNRDNISIVLTPSLDYIVPENHVYIYSRKYSYGGYRPRIIWTSHVYDDTPPGINIKDPQENQMFDNTPPSFNVQIWDRLSTGIDSHWYTINNGITNYPFSLTNFKTGMDSYGEYISGDGIGVINQDAWNALENGNIMIRFYAKDSNGNVANKKLIVIKNVTNPININDPTEVIDNIIPFIAGFSVVGLIAVVAVIYLKKVRK